MTSLSSHPTCNCPVTCILLLQARRDIFVPPLRVTAITRSQERNVFQITGNWGNRLLIKKKKKINSKTKQQWLLGNSTEPTGIVMLFQPSKMYLNKVLYHIQTKVIVTR